MLLEHEENYTVVQSDAKSILQHDAFSWQMQGTKMLYADSPSETSLHTNHVIREWLSTLEVEKQRLFVDAVFEIACSVYGDTLPEDVERSWPSSVQAVFSALWSLDAETRSLFHSVLGELFSAAIKTIRFPWQKDDDHKKGKALDTLLDRTKLEEPTDG